MANLDIIIRAQNLASAALRQVEGQLSGVQRQASFSERGFGGLQRAVGVGMVAAAGLAVTAIGALSAGLAKSVTAAADFESQINILTVAARSSGTTMEDLSKAALQVGADSQLVGISASEAADAMTNFYKAGLTTNEIFADMQGYLAGTVPLTGALRSAIDLAAASELDLAAASDVVAIAMATFGLEAADAARIADVLVGAADASLASVGGLAEALKNVGPIAATMGISLEDTSTALAILSTRGIQGAEAGTAMRSMLLNLQRPTKAVTTALDELGVSLYSTDGTMRALPDVIGQLEGALSGLTEEQRNQYAVTLAGSYGLNAFNVLVGEGTEGWNEMAESVANAATAQETAAARTKGFNAAIEQLKGALETLMITVGTPLIQKFLTPAAQKMGDVITQLTKMVPSVEQVGATYDKLHLRLLIMKERLTAFVGPIAEAIGQFAKWKDVLIVLGGVVASIVIPFLAGIAAVAAPVLVVFSALVGAVSLIRNAWEKDWGGIQGNTQAVIDRLRVNLDTFKGWIANIWDGIKVGDLQPLLDSLSGKLTLDTAWKGNFELAAKTKINWGEAQASLTSLKTKIEEKLAGLDWSGAANNLADLHTALKNKIAELDWSKMADAASSAINRALTALGTLDFADSSALVGLQSKVMDTVFKTLNDIDWTTAGATLGGFVNGIIDARSKIDFSAGGEFLGKIANGIITALSTIDFGKLGVSLLGVASALVQALADLDWTALGQSIGGIVNSLVTALGQESLWTNLGTAFAGLVNGVVTAIGSIRWYGEGGSVDSSIFGGLSLAVVTAIEGIDWSAAVSALRGSVWRWVLDAVTFGASEGRFFGGIGQNYPVNGEPTGVIYDTGDPTGVPRRSGRMGERSDTSNSAPVTINNYVTVNSEQDIVSLTERILSQIRRQQNLQAWQPTF